MKTVEELHSLAQGGHVNIVQFSYCSGRSKWVLMLTNWLIDWGYEFMMCCITFPFCHGHLYLASFALICYTQSQKVHTLQSYHWTIHFFKFSLIITFPRACSFSLSWVLWFLLCFHSCFHTSVSTSDRILKQIQIPNPHLQFYFLFFPGLFHVSSLKLFDRNNDEQFRLPDAADLYPSVGLCCLWQSSVFSAVGPKHRANSSRRCSQLPHCFLAST